MVKNIFHRLILFIFFPPLIFIISGFLQFDTYLKPVKDVTHQDRLWADPDEELHQLAIDRNYLGFAILRAKHSIPGAIGGFLTLSGLDVVVNSNRRKK